MTDLISTLKAQHGAIRNLVVNVDNSLAANDLSAVQKNVVAFREALGTHLALEDNKLYPGLKAAAETTKDNHLHTVATAFASTMHNISDGLGRILGKYDQGVRSVDEFKRDWTTLKDVLASRMRSEESSLYVLYARAYKEAPPAR